ncbi:hypothetical protein SAY87_000067 [Trapa incisa]|uniref:Uncharacterized protein n=1 Tax=Trapa incisa TaxID=236973 RepID=A0AAN7GES4_9MYRT|nr:hypothetical protein SAY87_000067 [Trapa incisa]
MWELCIYYNKKTVSMRRSCEQNIPWQLAGGTLRDRRIRSFIRGGAVEGLGIICLVQSPGPCVWDPPLSLCQNGVLWFSPFFFSLYPPFTHHSHQSCNAGGADNGCLLVWCHLSLDTFHN